MQLIDMYTNDTLTDLQKAFKSSDVTTMVRKVGHYGSVTPLLLHRRYGTLTSNRATATAPAPRLCFCICIIFLNSFVPHKTRLPSLCVIRVTCKVP